MKYNKILITGGYGFIGINFIQLLKNKKINYLNIDKITYASKEKFKKIKDKKHLKFDINNSKKLFKSINSYKPNAIIHFAAETHVDNSIKNSDDFIKTNILGTHSLLKNSYEYYKKLKNKDKKNFKCILVSTDEVYGSLKRGSFSELSPMKPNSPYAASKASGDMLFRSWIKTYNYPGIILNCSNNYGPFQHPEKLIPKIIKNLYKNKKIPIYGNGKNIRNWLFVEDCCNGILEILKKGKIGERYNLGGNVEIDNLEIVKNIFNFIIKKHKEIKFKKFYEVINYVEDRKGHDYRYSLSSKKVFKEVGWKPNTTMKVGLKKTIDWYIKNN